MTPRALFFSITRDPLFVTRSAVSSLFFMMGFGLGMWAVHVPEIQQRLDIDPGTIGLALLTLSAGAVIAMAPSGWLVGRFGSTRPTVYALIGYVLTLAGPFLAPTVPLFFISLFVIGLLIGALEILANVQASDVEKARDRPTMSSFHAFFSLGGLSGAVFGGLVISLGFGDGTGAAAAAVALLVLALWAIRHLYTAGTEHEDAPQFVLPPRPVLILGLLTALCFAIEGAVTDWSALFLTDIRNATPAEAASGYAVFSAAMALVRLFGDPVVSRFGARTILIGGGALMVAGLAVVLLSPSPLVGALGFGLVGIGCANTVPVLYSAAARTPGVPPGIGVASVATMGFAGFLAAPPLLGFVADSSSLLVSLSIVLAMSLGVIVLGLSHRQPDHEPD